MDGNGKFFSALWLPTHTPGVSNNKKRVIIKTFFIEINNKVNITVCTNGCIGIINSSCAQCLYIVEILKAKYHSWFGILLNKFCK